MSGAYSDAFSDAYDGDSGARMLGVRLSYIPAGNNFHRVCGKQVDTEDYNPDQPPIYDPWGWLWGNVQNQTWEWLYGYTWNQIVAASIHQPPYEPPIIPELPPDYPPPHDPVAWVWEDVKLETWTLILALDWQEVLDKVQIPQVTTTV